MSRHAAQAMERARDSGRFGGAGHSGSQPVDSRPSQEAPGAYKDVGAAVAAAEQAGLAVAFRDCVRSFASRAEIPRRRVDRRTSFSTLSLRFALGQNQAPKAEAVQRARCTAVVS